MDESVRLQRQRTRRLHQYVFCGIADEPNEAIIRLVEAKEIDVVVMGTVARSGIAGVLMGNTAEPVLQRLRGSVVALKPPGFWAPIAKD